MSEKYFQIDRIDKEILAELKKNSKISLRELSIKVGLPITSIYRRIKKLEEKGIIKSYTIKIDYEKLGFNVLAFILIKYDPTSRISQRELLKRLEKFDKVEEGFIITGEYDILLKVVSRDIKELSDFILNTLRNIEGIKETVTMIVLKGL